MAILPLMAFYPLEALLLSSLMCVKIAIIAAILTVVLWRIDSAAALKRSGYRLESFFLLFFQFLFAYLQIVYVSFCKTFSGGT